ncbi:MAG: Uma2 family endonuclease [Anaerolineae bacterium]|nr:Uma2 family endonuclease [Anaerolineae bacterium]
MTTREKINRAVFEVLLSKRERGEYRIELIDGEISETMPTQLHGWIMAILSAALFNFLRLRPIGWVLVEARYGLPEDDAHDLIPDLSFVRKERGPLVEKGPAPYMPDLAVEVQSPDDNPRVMAEKAAYYLAHGSRMVWLIYPSLQTVEVLTAGKRQRLTLKDALTGGDMLPGFSLPLQELFAPAL